MPFVIELELSANHIHQLCEARYDSYNYDFSKFLGVVEEMEIDTIIDELTKSITESLDSGCYHQIRDDVDEAVRMYSELFLREYQSGSESD